ncbi:MAG: hypothetical protein IPM06_18510 [Rhizobiales bacterium]|nr:hypothetical protein [Hyphomicrobiales bacterium]
MPQISVNLDQTTHDLLQAEAHQLGVSLEEVAFGDRPVKDVAREKLHQALSRDFDAGKIPSELVASAIAFGLKVKADREQSKAKGVV